MVWILAKDPPFFVVQASDVEERLLDYEVTKNKGLVSAVIQLLRPFMQDLYDT